MKTNLIFDFTVNKENNTINVKRAFAAPLDKVWAAWTTSELLDQWWAPKPYQAKTKSMDFSEGGFWLYAMIGPQGEEHWSRADFSAINKLKNFKAKDAFCDENGNITSDLPMSVWTNSFTEDGETTMVDINIQYDELADLEKIMDMGFKEGFTMGLNNLDELLAAK